MITEPTVLILGAGASAPYGYPTGESLRGLVLDLLASAGSGLLTFLKEVGIDEGEIERFRKKFQQSGQRSIDAFLEFRREFIEVGKLSIAFVLMNYENEETLFEFGDMQGPWYPYLWEKMRAGGMAELAENKLSVITFNYDRSLEHYLHTVSRNTFHGSADECAAALSRISIIHVHGCLGWLPWQGCRATREYRAPTHDEWGEVVKCAGLIKIMSEGSDVDADEEFAQAHEVLARATRVCFLGFGYNPTNVARLHLENIPNNANLQGTCYGHTANETGGLQSMLSKAHKGLGVANPAKLGGSKVEVLGHLRHTGILE